jgi:hypothetical protein
MNTLPAPSDDAEPWAIPLFGVEVPGPMAPSTPDLVLADFFPEYAQNPTPTLIPDEEVPNGEFRPRLSRFGEAA